MALTRVTKYALERDFVEREGGGCGLDDRALGRGCAEMVG